MQYLAYILIAVVVVLTIKSLLTQAAQSYMDDFFNDPTGGIVPVPEKVNTQKVVPSAPNNKVKLTLVK